MRQSIRTAVAVLALATTARASETELDPARCKASYEAAQVSMQGDHLEAARAQLATCQRICPAPLARDCTRWLDEVAKAAPTVRLGARDLDGRPLPDVLVTLDGVLVEHRGRAVQVEPGVHVFRFERAGYVPQEARVEVHAGEHDRPVAVILAAEKPPSAEPPAPSPVPSYVVGGLGAAALVASAVLAIDGHVTRSDLRSTCAPNCDPSDVDRIRTLWITSAALGIAGAIAVGVAIAIWPGWTRSSASVRRGAIVF